MKIEINIVKDGSGIPYACITSPSSDEIIMKSLPENIFAEIEDTNVKDVMSMVADNFCTTDRSPEDGVFVTVKKNKIDGEKVCMMIAYGEIRAEETEIDGAATIIPKKEYKSFKKANPLQKLEMAFLRFKPMIDELKNIEE